MSQPGIDYRYMEFRLGNQLYAIPLLSVKEVVQKPEVTIVPNMPPYFDGMINLRGKILGVFNIKKKFAKKSPESGDKVSEVVIVVEQNGISTGMTVDEVTRVLHADADKIGPAPLQADDPAHRYIVSVIQTEKDLVQTIDVVQLLEFEKHKTLNTAA